MLTDARAAEHIAHCADLAAHGSYRIALADQPEDPDWDAFLMAMPGGRHVQSSLWAQAQAVLGWRAMRIILWHEERIVAGAQLLLRSLPVGGTIGYVRRGPLLAVDDPHVAHLMMAELLRVARAHRVRYLAVQPPYNGEALARQLPGWGFRVMPREAEPTATLLLDLTQDLDDLLARMRPKTRYNLHLGQRKGITVRQGTDHDLQTFYQLLLATSRRQAFLIYPEEFFAALWRVLGPRGYLKLFVAEYAGEAISGLLAIPFGNTVTFWEGGWSGRHGRYHPNETMHWAAITWAKSQGYRYYDFEGIDPQVARAITRGEPAPDLLTHTVSRFKLGFGGQVTLCPEAYEYVPNPLLRSAYVAVVEKIVSRSLLAKVGDAVRGVARG